MASVYALTARRKSPELTASLLSLTFCRKRAWLWAETLDVGGVACCWEEEEPADDWRLYDGCQKKSYKC